MLDLARKRKNVNPFGKKSAAALFTDDMPDKDLDVLAEGFSNELRSYEKEISGAVAFASALVVHDPDTDTQAISLAGEMRKLSKRIDESRKSAIKPAQDFVKKANIFAASFTDRLDEAVKKLVEKSGAYKTEIARQQESRLAEEAAIEEALGLRPVLKPIEAVGATKTEHGSTYQLKSWQIELMDITKVPPQFLMLNEAAVKAALKAGLVEIPGVKAMEIVTTHLRAN